MRLPASEALYFPFVIALLKVSRRLPLWCRRRIVRVIALAAYFISRRKRRLTQLGLDAAFGADLTWAEKRELAKASFYQFWCETFWMVPSSAEVKQIGTMRLRGEEHFRRALSRGRGVILLETNSFGSRVVARRVLHRHGYALHQVHGPNHLGSGFVVSSNRWNWAANWFGRFLQAREMEFLTEIVLLPDSGSLAFTRILLDRLQQNLVLCMSLEGKLSQRLIDLPFLGIKEGFSTGIVSLARASGAAVLPLFCLRQPDARPEVIIESEIEIDTSVGRDASLLAAVRRCAAILEGYSRRNPEQFYAWSEIGSKPPA
jgi:lauroyl/myristoyl acyltransferase